MQRRVLAGLTATHVVDDFYQGAVPAILPFLVAERHYSYAGATGIVLAATILSSLVQPAFGLVTDRYRARWLVAVGPLLAGTGVGLAGVGHSYALTWFAVALSGFGVAAYHPEASRSARMAAGRSAQGMSWFAVGGNGGVALGPVVVAPVLAATGVAGTPLLAIPAFVMAVVLCGTWLVAAARRRSAALAAGPAGVPTPARRGAVAGEPVDDWRAFGWLTGVVIARSITYFGIVSFLALLLISRMGVPKSVASAALTTFTGVGAAGTILGGRLADRIGRVRTVRLGYALTIPALLALVLARDPVAAFAAAAVLGVGVYIPFSVHVTLGQEYLPNRIGTASGLTLGLAVSVGGLVAPLLGVLADAHGITTSLTVLAVAPGAALVLSSRLREPVRPVATVPVPG